MAGLIGITAAICALVSVAAALYFCGGRVPPASGIHLELTTPPTTQPESLAISPDGQKILFVATSKGRPSLWLRALDADAAKVLPGTEGASRPFWSADSRSIGFFADARLKRSDIDGGSAKILASASYRLGGTWNTDGVILFTPVPGRPILRVSASGGPVTAVTRIDRSTALGHTDPAVPPGQQTFPLSRHDSFSRRPGSAAPSGTRRLKENVAQKCRLGAIGSTISEFAQ